MSPVVVSSAAVLPRTGLGDGTHIPRRPKAGVAEGDVNPGVQDAASPSLAGFTMGQRFDFTNATFCAANKMTGWPAKELEKCSGFTCRSTERRGQFDEVQILVTKKMRVIEIRGICECKDNAAAKAKHAELKEWVMKTYSNRMNSDAQYNVEVYVADETACVTLSESDKRHAYSAAPN